MALKQEDKPGDRRTYKRKLGDLGEDFAYSYLKRRGFEVLERNYLRRWGEIDIVARKGGIMRFVEVKSVSYVTSRSLESMPQASATKFGQGESLTKSAVQRSVTPFGQGVTLTKKLWRWLENFFYGTKPAELRDVKHETDAKNNRIESHLRPEENMHPGKLSRLARTMQSYMLEKNLDCPFQLDLITVKIDLRSREATIEMLENIII